MQYVSPKSISFLQAISRTVAILILGITLVYLIDSKHASIETIAPNQEVKELHAFHNSYIYCEAVDEYRKKVMEVREERVLRVFASGEITEMMERDTIEKAITSLSYPCPKEFTPALAKHVPLTASLGQLPEWKDVLTHYRNIFQE